MKKILSFLIGMIVVFSGMHLMPTHTMAKEMEVMQHCSMCDEEDLKTDNCIPPASDANNERENFDDLFPLGNNCDCTFEQNDGNHHTGLLSFGSRQLKQKTFAATFPQSLESMTNGQAFLTTQKINAPPSYLNAHKTVQRLE